MSNEALVKKVLMATAATLAFFLATAGIFALTLSVLPIIDPPVTPPTPCTTIEGCCIDITTGLEHSCPPSPPPAPKVCYNGVIEPTLVMSAFSPLALYSFDPLHRSITIYQNSHYVMNTSSLIVQISTPHCYSSYPTFRVSSSVSNVSVFIRGYEPDAHLWSEWGTIIGGDASQTVWFGQVQHINIWQNGLESAQIGLLYWNVLMNLPCPPQGSQPVYEIGHFEMYGDTLVKYDQKWTIFVNFQGCWQSW